MTEEAAVEHGHPGEPARKRPRNGNGNGNGESHQVPTPTEMASEAVAAPLEVSCVAEAASSPEEDVARAIARNAGEIGRLEEELSTLRSRIGEREKELACHMLLSNMLDEFTVTSTATQNVMQDVANILPPAWQYPGSACARVTLFCGGSDPGELLDDAVTGAGARMSRETANFRETQWRIAADVSASFPERRRVGVIEVFYLDERPEADEGPFLAEERNLLNVVAERFGTFITQKLVEQQVERLTGLLHICSCCRSVREPSATGRGGSQWKPVDQFLQEHCPSLTFTRGMCPTCASRIYASAVASVADPPPAVISPVPRTAAVMAAPRSSK